MALSNSPTRSPDTLETIKALRHRAVPSFLEFGSSRLLKTRPNESPERPASLQRPRVQNKYRETRDRAGLEQLPISHFGQYRNVTKFESRHTRALPSCQWATITSDRVSKGTVSNNSNLASLASDEALAHERCEGEGLSLPQRTAKNAETHRAG